MRMKEVPVYLFTGFLDTGKTTFIQETMESSRFNDGLKTLLLVCEEGEEEYQVDKFASDDVAVIFVEDCSTLTPEFLSKVQRDSECEKVVVEYNGMWLLDSFYDSMPENWIVYQEMAFLDGKTIVSYNNNMRQLVYDKLKSAETVVFKNCKKDMDKMELHQIVRGANRRSDIIYEYGPEDIELDRIEDALPFDVDAPVIEIGDEDYAWWYSDLNEEEEKYYGKDIILKGRCLVGGELDKDEFVIGRHIMTCCIDDIQFGGLMAKWPDAETLEQGEWVIIEAKIVFEYNKMYKSKGPVFHVKKLEKCEPLLNDVATFY